MRILLVCHVQPHGALPDQIERLARQINADGYEVHCIVCSNEPIAIPGVTIRHLLGERDVSFLVPTFARHDRHPHFSDLDEEQIAEYRRVLRRVIIEETDTFDPWAIHCFSWWLCGTLCLETGVPYVVQVGDENLDLYREDERYRYWMDQAAENASRVLLETDQQHAAFSKLVEVDQERLLLLTEVVHTTPLEPDRERFAQLLALYRELHAHRY